jgi:signal transduction histidine kinase/DNA-binding response OmpR family regulator
MKKLTTATVLIVDDELPTRLLLDQWLSGQGLSTVMAGNGDEALAQIALQAPDLILLDIMMPGLGGYELAKILKANPATSHIPIIVLTSLSDRKARLVCLAAGAEDFLVKPVEPEELTLRVRNHLRLKQLGDYFKDHSRALAEQVQAREAELLRLLDQQASEAARQAAVLNSSTARIAMLDSQGFIVDVNETWRQFSKSNGIENPACGVGANYLDVCQNAKSEDSEGATDSKVVATEIRAVLSGESTGFSMEYACHSPDEKQWFMMMVNPVSAGSLSGAIVRHFNITENKLAQDKISRLHEHVEEGVRQRTAQLLVSNQELEAFSYSVSHDLRTPLSTIDGFSALLAKELSAASSRAGREVGERAEHYLSRIRLGVTHMVDLVEAMLSMAQTTHDQLRRESVDLSALAEKVIASHREREPGRAVLVDIQANLMTYGDARLLHQVLQNLIGNAWKFSSQEPETHIAFSQETRDDGEQVYAVQDKGVGFDMAHYGELFGAFRRLHSTKEFAGTGIGLATVNRIVERHGGRVWAESAPGQGARFYFTLGTKQPCEVEPLGMTLFPESDSIQLG